MDKYFCYKRIPERFVAGGYCSYPGYRRYMTVKQWIAAGKPTTNDITFYGQGRPPQLQAWWDKKEKEGG